jgi:hypothetical protein
MKVWISRYRSHWLSPYTILKAVCFWERDEDRIYNLKDEPDNPYVLWVKLLDPVCRGLQWFLDRIHPRWTYVRIDPWDTWSFDHTLADIILPGLKQLQATKHGAPFVDDEDVPEGMNLRSTEAEPKENEWDTDSNHFKRWDWVLAEMIWAFEQKVKDDADSQFFDHSAYEESGDTNHHRWLNDLSEGVSKVKYDQEGHQKWQERKANGFRLFGRYFENLWD